MWPPHPSCDLPPIMWPPTHHVTSPPIMWPPHPSCDSPPIMWPPTHHVTSPPIMWPPHPSHNPLDPLLCSLFSPSSSLPLTPLPCVSSLPLRSPVRRWSGSPWRRFLPQPVSTKGFKNSHTTLETSQRQTPSWWVGRPLSRTVGVTSNTVLFQC